jgi:hypothetical protein
MQTTIPCPDGFFSEVSSDGSHLLFSTYLGATHGASTRSIALNRAGAIVLAGEFDRQTVVSMWK